MSAIVQEPRSFLWPLKYAALLPRTPIRTLLAADDPGLRSRVTAALHSDGQEVSEVTESNGRINHIAAALWSDAHERPDILVGSLRTGDDTDLEALSALRRSSGLPMVLIAPAGNDAPRLKAYRMGADIVLAEPLDVDELLISVRALVPDKG
jgi:DNA-binding response OmpR family regulator